ncbi:uridine kinase [Phenylobacterium sp.]|uniref:uridine kinase family protein n=1 Tax=Phenylobacterium sp. TaxID=1871053 RepID=UPI0027269C07|nr:hypothetical protein [Phenylobacterium sp.]MDO8379107.1 hypothetical protein [Phenylobacterium sp.]
MRLNFDEIVETVASKPKPLLVALDGLPLAGKSTLAERLVRELGAECLWLDDFVKPEGEWPSRNTPSFPFDYVRYDAFMAAIHALARFGRCSYHPYDWSTGSVSSELKVVSAERLAVVEGVSALHPDLAPLYDLRVWVESDPETTLSAAFERGVGAWAREWEMMFLPSAMLYLQSDPKTRADVIAAGRGSAG